MVPKIIMNKLIVLYMYCVVSLSFLFALNLPMPSCVFPEVELLLDWYVLFGYNNFSA